MYRPHKYVHINIERKCDKGAFLEFEINTYKRYVTEIFSEQEENSGAERTLSNSPGIFHAKEFSLLHCLIFDLYISASVGPCQLSNSIPVTGKVNLEL